MNINFIIIFILISIISNILSGTIPIIYATHFKKGQRLIVPRLYNAAIFDSESFEEGDSISFKITTYKFNDDDIKFEFRDNDPTGATFVKDHRESTEIRRDAEDVYNSDVWEGEGKTYYYTIKKDKNYLENNIKGKYLVILYDAVQLMDQ